MNRLLLAAFALLACAPKTGRLRVDWAFDGQSCARASVLLVRVQIDEETPKLVACSDDSNRLGATFDKLLPGPHRLKLSGLGVGGAQLWTFEQDDLSVSAGQTASVQAAFERTAVANPLEPTTPAMNLDDVPPPE